MIIIINSKNSGLRWLLHWVANFHFSVNAKKAQETAVVIQITDTSGWPQNRYVESKEEEELLK